MRMTNSIRDQCSFSTKWHVLLCHGPAFEGISRPIKHSLSHRSLQAAIHFVAFVVHIRIRTNRITPVLIPCTQFFLHSHSSFAFALHTSGILDLRWTSKQNIFISKAYFAKVSGRWTDLDLPSPLGNGSIDTPSCGNQWNYQSLH